MIIYSDLFCYKNHRFHLVILDFSSTNGFQIRARLFWKAFALQLGLQKNGEFTTAHSNQLQVTYLHHYKLTVYLPLKHLLTPKFQPLHLPLSTTEGGSLLLPLFSSQRSWGKAGSYLLDFFFPFRWIWTRQTFILMVWAGHSPWYTVYGPVKRYNLIQMTLWTLSMLLRGFVKDEHLLSLPQPGRTEAGLQQPPSSLVYKYTSAAVVNQGEQHRGEGDLLCSVNRLRGKVSLQHL